MPEPHDGSGSESTALVTEQVQQSARATGVPGHEFPSLKDLLTSIICNSNAGLSGFKGFTSDLDNQTRILIHNMAGHTRILIG